jgi:spore germination protein
MAPWEASSIASVETNHERISELNPVWYSIAADGGIAVNWNGEKPIRAAGVKLVPTIQNVVNGAFDATFAARLGDPNYRMQHASALAALVHAKNFDGIDIDYERLPSTSRAAFSSFLAMLASRLHAEHKELSVTISPKIRDDQNWPGPGAQDWRFLGRVADSIKVMAYDYHYGSTEGGALTPLDWLDAIARYGDATIGRRKVLIGLPWYGYDWLGKTAKPVSFDDARKLAEASGATVQRDVNGEPFFTYADHIVYYQDAESYGRKVRQVLRNHRSVAGIAHWHSGNEDPAVWERVGELRKRRLRLPFIMRRSHDAKPAE